MTSESTAGARKDFAKLLRCGFRSLFQTFFSFLFSPVCLTGCRRLVEVLLYVHGNRRFIRDGSPGRPPGFSHSS